MIDGGLPQNCFAMQRLVSLLSKTVYDVAVIGGGIHGAWVACDAALRGLSVALVERGDFGGATSANSHKIIHGGLRYLQHGDIGRMRESIRERQTLMRVAPHLVHPFPFLIPTYRDWMQSKLVMAVALKLNDLIAYDCNRSLQPQQYIPRSRLLSKTACLQLCPGLEKTPCTGGALFYDGQVHNPDRLTLSILWSAVSAGAHVANYIRVTGFLHEGNAITGLQAEDMLTGAPVKVRARMVVNCSGPWSDCILGFLNNGKQRASLKLAKAVVLVTRPLLQKIALGVPCRSRYRDDDAVLNKGYRFFFITPWRQTSLIGTFQAPYDGAPDDFKVTEQDIRIFINQVNAAYPAAALTRQDVRFVYGGLLPQADSQSETPDVQYMKQARLCDHEREDGIRGLVSVIGVKYTTARSVAEKTINLVLRKLGKKLVPCRTAVTPVYGGVVGHFEDFVSQAVDKKPPGVGEEVIRHLISTYGAAYQGILHYAEEVSGWSQPVLSTSPVVKAEVIHAVRAEMAQRLSDVIFRRTELGTAGSPGGSCFEACAALMATQLRWNKKRIAREIEAVEAAFSGERV